MRKLFWLLQNLSNLSTRHSVISSLNYVRDVTLYFLKKLHTVVCTKVQKYARQKSKFNGLKFLFKLRYMTSKINSLKLTKIVTLELVDTGKWRLPSTSVYGATGRCY